METIKLTTPIKINGEDIAELTFDVNKVDADGYFAAFTRRGDEGRTKLPFQDLPLMFEFGVQSVLAENTDKGWSAEDFKRLTAPDVTKLVMVGMRFFK